jgi:dihydroceramidase
MEFNSFRFHATLRYEWQLGDELPMIFCCAFITYVTFDTGSISQPRTRFVRCLPYLLFIYSFGVSAIYLRYPNPVFHQVAYAFIQLSVLPFSRPSHTPSSNLKRAFFSVPSNRVATFRSAYTVRAAPEGTYREQKNKADATRYLLIGSITFITGFLIWNIDNL